MHASNIGVAYNNLAQAESIVRAADLEWTIVRPTRLTHGSGTGRWRADPSLVTSSTARISRADLARFLVHNLSDPAWVRTAVSLTQG